jgi:hypothetical protein
MNRIQFVFRDFNALFIAMVLLGLGSNAYAENKGCWAEFYENSQYSGKHFRIEGSTQLGNLNNISGENWDLRIDSLKVGPKAKVIVYENPNFKLTLTEMARYPDLMHSLGVTEKDIKEDSELIFTANEKIHDLSDFNFRQKVRSLKVECL